MKLPTKIPKELYPMFWDVDPKKVNPAKFPYFVIQRLLDKGDARGVRWVEKKFGKDMIKKTFQTMRDFRPEVGNFWQLMLNIPQNQVLCLQKSYQEMRKSVWPY